MPERDSRPSARAAASTPVNLDAELCQLNLTQRVAALSAPARTLHRAVLRAFLDSGHAPALAELRPVARKIGVGLERMLAELVVHDVIQRAADGAIQVAYPFSSTPTPHQVHIDGTPPVFAMCIIDALGLPFMVGRPATIFTLDPSDATPITITIEPATGSQTWIPTTVVVLANECQQEPAIKAECACPFINAFASPDTAERWRTAHPEQAMRLLSQEAALTEARALFGALLDGTVNPAR